MTPDSYNSSKTSESQSGNVFFFILLAIVLIGLVTVALRSGGGSADIDNETVLINATTVRQYAGELERGIAFILHDGASENDIRFANRHNADYGNINDQRTRQVFAAEGGGVEYRLPIPAISGASQWEFYGHTHLPGVGSDRPELVAVLPDVTEAFCTRINKMNNYDQATQPTDNSGDCINAGAAFRFTSAVQFSTGGGIDTTDEASFTVQPAMEGCVQCGADYHFFHVLMAR